jgi:signal peptidase
MRFIVRTTSVVRRVVDLGLLALIVVVLVTVVFAKGAPLVGRQSIVIGGGSMEPTMPLGSAIIVAPVDASALAIGDVVSMQVGQNHATYTHRIIDLVDRADGRWIRTKGDANAEPDPTLVPVSAVIGRVELTVPLLGYLLALLSLPVGVIFILGLAATLLAIAWLLESLEPDRVVVTTMPHDPVTGAGAPPRPTDSAPVRAADIAVSRGEPIAVRPPRRREPAEPALATAFAGPSILVRGADASVARPTVREQVARSREVRDRRARWQSGRRRRDDRPGSD